MKRMVDTSIWVDARVESLGSMAKLLWLYILTSPQGNLAGCFELTMRRIEVDTGIKAAQAQKILDELCAAGLICCSADTGEVLIVRWRKHNWSGGSTKLAKPLASAIQDVKDPRFRAYLAEVYYQVYSEPIFGFEEIAGKYPIDILLDECRYPSISISIPTTVPKGVGGTGEGEPDVKVAEAAEEIVAYLNAKLGTHYKPKSRDTLKRITARLREGFAVEDFKTVIDKKAAAWQGTEFSQYLRPETLFGTKFEGYLNEIQPRPRTLAEEARKHGFDIYNR